MSSPRIEAGAPTSPGRAAAPTSPGKAAAPTSPGKAAAPTSPGKAAAPMSPGEAPPQAISVDEEDYDSGNDGYGSDLSSATTSLMSSVMHYKYENGRRYHAFGKEDAYVLPNDEEEQDRLDLYHHIWSMVLKGELHTAPLDNPQRILDIGTGTGIWAIDIADKYPEAEVIGNDLSPVQPSWIPPNLKFEIDDMDSSSWVFPKNHFDFIHLRTMANCFEDWDLIVQRAYEHLKPGGYLEIQDYDYEVLNGPPGNPLPMNPESPFLRWVKLTTGAAEKAGRPFVNGKTQGDRLKRGGFANVTARYEMWPYSPWHKEKSLKERGQYILLGTQQALINYSVALLTRYMGMEKAEVEKLCRDTSRELVKGKQEYWQKAWFVYGQKPFEAEGRKK